MLLPCIEWPSYVFDNVGLDKERLAILILNGPVRYLQYLERPALIVSGCGACESSLVWYYRLRYFILPLSRSSARVLLPKKTLHGCSAASLSGRSLLSLLSMLKTWSLRVTTTIATACERVRVMRLNCGLIFLDLHVNRCRTENNVHSKTWFL